MVDLRSHQVIGAEALLRWEHPTPRSDPSVGIHPIAERAGLIVPIGKWVIDRSIQLQRAGKQRGRKA